MQTDPMQERARAFLTQALALALRPSAPSEDILRDVWRKADPVDRYRVSRFLIHGRRAPAVTEAEWIHFATRELVHERLRRAQDFAVHVRFLPCSGHVTNRGGIGRLAWAQ